MADKIVWAIKNGDLDQVKSICDAEPIDVNAELSQRFPLHIAADYGQADVLKFLLEKGANVNQLDKHGISPLLAAIWEGHTACVRVLLDHGADKTGKTPNGESFAEVADKAEIKQLLC